MTKYTLDFPTSHDLNMMPQHHLDLILSEGLYFGAHPGITYYGQALSSRPSQSCVSLCQTRSRLTYRQKTFTGASDASVFQLETYRKRIQDFFLCELASFY